MSTLPKTPGRATSRSASPEFSRELVFYDDAATQRRLRQQFGEEIDRFIVRAAEAHAALDEEFLTWPRGQRAQNIRLFLHTALQNLYVGMHLTVSGYPLAGGHQLRCHFEALAMAFLLHIDSEWSRFRREMGKYPAHDAISRVTKRGHSKHLRASLKLSQDWWTLVAAAAKHFNNHSHSGLFAALHSFKGTWPGKAIMGGEYDPARRQGYSITINLAGAGAQNLGSIVRAMAKRVPDLKD